LGSDGARRSSALEQKPKKLINFFDEIWRHHFESTAVSYRSCGCAWSISALIRRGENSSKPADAAMAPHALAAREIFRRTPQEFADATDFSISKTTVLDFARYTDLGGKL
jgi:hypothetical protein